MWFFWKRHSCIYIFRILFYLFVALSVQFLLSYCCIGTELYTYNNRSLFFKRKQENISISIDISNSISCRQKLILLFRKEHRNIANLQRIDIFKHQKSIEKFHTESIYSFLQRRSFISLATTIYLYYSLYYINTILSSKIFARVYIYICYSARYNLPRPKEIVPSSVKGHRFMCS